MTEREGSVKWSILLRSHKFFCNCYVIGFSDMAYNFKKKVYGSEVVDYGVPYDYASIMHYPWTAFSKNGKKTLEPIRPLNGKTPYVKLSDDDALQARRMYKCPGKTVGAHACTVLLMIR